MTDKKTSNLNILRIVASILGFIGAIGSLYFMFNAGRHQKSILLIILFTGWVLSPFIGLFVATKISNPLKVPPLAIIYWLIIILAISSLIAYSGALIPQGTKTAFIFLIGPLTWWILIVLVFLIGRRHQV